MKNLDRLTKTLLALLVIGVWGLLLKPLLLNGTPAHAQQQSPPAPFEEREIVHSPNGVSASPTAVVISNNIYVIGDGYITRYSTNSGSNLVKTESQPLPSRSVTKVRVPVQPTYRDRTP